MSIVIFLCILFLTKVYQSSGWRTVCKKDEQRNLINTTGCQIPYLFVNFQDKKLPIDCGQRDIHIKKMKKNRIQFEIFKPWIPCCFSYINRDKEIFLQDFRVEHTICQPFQNGTIVPLNGELIVVKCGRLRKKPDYEDHFSFVRPAVPERWYRPRTNPKAENYNVILLGVDSMSRARAYHSLPKTVQFLRKENWLDFRAFNKVTKDTTGNLIALLTGKSENEEGPKKIPSHCFYNISACNHLMIWDRYENADYVTSLASDGSLYSTFFNYKNGFTIKPTNHYLRPLFLDGERQSYTGTGGICTGKVTSRQQILDHSLDFVNTYKKRKFFGLFWIFTVGREVGQSPRSHDEAFLSYFSTLKRTGIMDNSFVFFFSDHGIKFGNVKNQMSSYYEERLPMLFVSVPRKFKKKHPKKFSSLKTNQWRLVSPYDLYLTLRNILNLRATKKSIQADSCRYCSSLFFKLPTTRKCACASVEEHWCTCHRMQETSLRNYDANMSMILAKKHVFDIPEKISTQPCTSCHKAYFRGLRRVHSYSYPNENEKYFVFAFVVTPDETYEVVVKRNKRSYDVVSADAISEFKDQGYCVLYTKDRNSCVCVSDKACWKGIHFWPEYKETIFKPKFLADITPRYEQI